MLSALKIAMDPIFCSCLFSMPCGLVDFEVLTFEDPASRSLWDIDTSVALYYVSMYVHCGSWGLSEVFENLTKISAFPFLRGRVIDFWLALCLLARYVSFSRCTSTYGRVCWVNSSLVCNVRFGAKEGIAICFWVPVCRTGFQCDPLFECTVESLFYS